VGVSFGGRTDAIGGVGDVIRSLLGDSTLNALERALDGATLRHEALANNIANVNTPGFKRSDVGFSGRLDGALAEGDRPGLSLLRAGAQGGPAGPRAPRGPGAGGAGDAGAAATDEWGPRVVTDAQTSARTDGNNVDIEVEMAEMSENSVWYQALLRQVSEKFSRLRLVATEGRR